MVEGWGKPKGAKKWHYFGQDRRSLCGSYAWFGNVLLQGDDIHPDNCKNCERKLQKLRSDGD